VLSMAGGLIAFGAGDRFEIDDARTGKPLWSFGLSQQVHASPMSYGIDGKQYLAVAAGDTVYAFGL
jgi:alcohol dehydrogenase (cytochrome c)